MINFTDNICRNWNIAFKKRDFVFKFLFSIVLLIIIMSIFSSFVQYVELRNGVQLNDPILNSFQAIDLTWPIFFFIYVPLLFSLTILVYYPFKLLILIQSYAMMILCRIIMMFTIPLAPPKGMIILKDPFIEFFGTEQSLTKDLFFSGHTATLFLLYLVVPKKFKRIYFIVTLLIMIGVLLQKVHYSIDVLVAPFISFACYHICSNLNKSFV